MTKIRKRIVYVPECGKPLVTQENKTSTIPKYCVFDMKTGQCLHPLTTEVIPCPLGRK